jgi:hypothetical protein
MMEKTYHSWVPQIMTTANVYLCWKKVFNNIIKYTTIIE